MKNILLMLFVILCGNVLVSVLTSAQQTWVLLVTTMSFLLKISFLCSCVAVIRARPLFSVFVRAMCVHQQKEREENIIIIIIITINK